MQLPLLPARGTEVTQGNSNLSHSPMREEAGLANSTEQAKGRGKINITWAARPYLFPSTSLSVGYWQAYAHRCRRTETHGAYSSLGLHLS